MKPRVLMIAYACDPGGTGEHWLGWGWAEAASRSFAVDLITTPKAQVAVEESARALGITTHFVTVPPGVRKLTELAGGSWLRKLAWQKRVARLAAKLHQEKKFSIVHQTTFHTFRVPFRAAGLGIPSVWGPIAGGERVPPGFERYLGSARLGELGRNCLNRLSLQTGAIRRSLRQASVLFVSNRTTLNFLPAWCQEKARIVPANALRPEDERSADSPANGAHNSVVRGPESDRKIKGFDGTAPSGPEPLTTELCAPLGKPSAFRLLYVGNCVATRALPIVFEALRYSALSETELEIVGAGPALEGWKRLAVKLGLSTRVKFLGKVPYAQLGAHYAAADALVFPALRDSGGSALLEAMARGLPIICLDWGGPGEMLDENSGLKIPVRRPEETVALLAEALVRLKNEPALGQKVAQAARQRALSLFRWEAKRELLEATYRGLL
jgi:glycosyltransferase involved in cell wall biosynthesis